jgi:DegV family protein with EDD domain
MAVLAKDSTILSQKIEDMKMMNNILHRPKNKIGIITDSIADISQELIDQEQITIIPVNLICDSVAYLDKLTMIPEVFYPKIDTYTMNPTSAQPSYNTIERSFLRLLEHFDSIIGIFVSKKMSGTYNNARKVANKLSKQNKKISVINSRLNSAGEGLLVLRAAKLIGDGLTHEAVVDKLNQIKSNIRIYVSVRDLSHMIKGGRISKVTGMILSTIKLQPVVSIDAQGNGVVCKKTLTQKSAVESILSTAKKDKKKFGIENYAVVYSDKKEDTNELKNKLEAIIGRKPDYFSPISPVVGLNAGKGSFAVAYIKGGV